MENIGQMIEMVGLYLLFFVIIFILFYFVRSIFVKSKNDINIRNIEQKLDRIIELLENNSKDM